MTGHEGKEVTSSLQYFIVNEYDCGKASMTGHEGKEVTGLVQCCAINKCHYGKTGMTGHEGKRGYRFTIVFHCK